MTFIPALKFLENTIQKIEPSNIAKSIIKVKDSASKLASDLLPDKYAILNLGTKEFNFKDLVAKMSKILAGITGISLFLVCLLINPALTISLLVIPILLLLYICKNLICE